MKNNYPANDKKSTDFTVNSLKDQTESFNEKALRTLQDAGLDVDHIDYSGKLIRVPLIDGKRGRRDGAYVAHADDPASVWFQNFTGQTGTVSAKNKSDMSQAERSELAKRMAEIRKIRAAEDARRHAEAAKKATRVYKAAAECTGHPYLTAKGIKPVLGLKVSVKAVKLGGHDFPVGSLIVPYYDENGNLTTLQYINEAGDKCFAAGGRKRGCCFTIGKDNPDGPMGVSEGVATGASVNECTGIQVMVASDVGNMEPVAKAIRAKYPDRKIIICADYDEPNKVYPDPGGIGVAMARKSAAVVRGIPVVPMAEDGEAVDWNDVHQKEGPEEVRRQFGAALDSGVTISASSEEEPLEEHQSRSLPPPPSVPMEAFPPQIADLLNEASEVFNGVSQIPAASLLGLLSSVVCGSKKLCIKDSWSEPGNLWIAVVADSGIGKSPCMREFLNSITDITADEYERFNLAYSDYEAQMSFYKRDFQKLKPDEPPLDKPVCPIRKRISVDDSTPEGLFRALYENHGSIAWNRDELSGLILDFDKYSRGKEGGTRSRLLSCYDGGSVDVNRSSSDATRNLFVKEAYVSILGGIQPRMMPKIFSAGDDGADEASGFLQRFIFIREERTRPNLWSDRSFSYQSQYHLRELTKTIWSWDRSQRTVIKMTPGAKEFYIHWFNSISREGFLSDNPARFEKLKGQALRVCLLLHCLDAALYKNDVTEPMTDDFMMRALLLADWIKAHQEQCWQFFKAEKSAKQMDPIERAIMQVIVDQAAKIETDGWRISNAELCSLVESNLGMTGLSNVKIGKAASSLGLRLCKIGRNDKGRFVQKELMDTFKTAVRTDRAVREPHKTRAEIADGSKNQPTATDRETTSGRSSGSGADGLRSDADGTKTPTDRIKTQQPQALRTVRSVRTGDSGKNIENDPYDEVMF